MRDLFSDPPVPGLVMCGAIIDLAEEAALIGHIEALDLAPFAFHGWLGKRKTRSFGWRYDFTNASFAETDPIPDWMLALRSRAAALAGLPASDLVQVLVTRYDPGAGIGWHRDRSVFDKLVGVSLGAPAILRFRQRSDKGYRRFAVPLEPRSAYLLSGDVRSRWGHGIAPGKLLRLSITFRSLVRPIAPR